MRALLVVPVVLALVPLTPAHATPASPVIAVLDTGILATHAAFAPGQVVAWYDFTNHAPRSNLTSWDPLVATPYDDAGHGTAVASMAAGLAGTGLTPSFAPGTSLAVARIGGPFGASWSDVSNGIRWAVDVAHADVITLSFYQYAIRPIGVSLAGAVSCCAYSASERQLLESIHYARTSGVFVTILAGNGENNQGYPTVSWMHVPEVTADALIVGGANSAGGPIAPRGSLDPEVTALYTVTAACPWSATCSTVTQGTSFSTPLAAGLAATLLSDAWALGVALPPAALETLMKRAAWDNLPYPAALEGYGMLDAGARSRADAILAGGAPPSGPAWDANVLYVETAREAGRSSWHRAGSAL